MPWSIRFDLRSIQGYGLPNGRSCLPCSGVSDRAIGMSPSFSCYDSNTKFLSLKCASRRTSCVVCNAESSRQNKHGFSRINENSLNEDRDGHEDFEDSSKDATPFHSENEIVELFPDAKSRLCELDAIMEERKIKESQGMCEEDDESLDSLLQYVREHAAELWKTNTSETIHKLNIDSDSESEYDPYVISDRYLKDLERKEDMEYFGEELMKLIDLLSR